MAFNVLTRGSFFVDGQFSSDGSRNIQGANVYFVDTETAQATEMDSITLAVIDHDGNQQYLLTTASTPAIELEEPANIYVVDEIDVQGFPDGYITLQWTGSLDGYEYIGAQFVEFNNAPEMLFVTGKTDSVTDFSFVLDQAKSVTIRTQDSIGNPVSGYAVRFVFQDRHTGATVEAISAGLISEGLWRNDVTLATGTYSADLDRYEFYAQIQLSNGGTWFEVEDSRTPIKVYGANANVTSGPLCYNSNEDMRLAFPGIDRMLEDIVANQGEREAWLNQNRLEASTLLHPQVKNTRVRANSELLKQLANFLTYRLILTKAQAFGRFGVPDAQLKDINQHISRLYNSLFGSISTISIGGRFS